MTTTAFDDQFAPCTPEEDEAFRAIEARQRECAAERVQESQRERFEAWAKGATNYAQQRVFLLGKDEEGNYRQPATRGAWLAWQAACPDGWQSVPVDPTAAMMKALWLDDPFARHSTMLSAAPKPEDV